MENPKDYQTREEGVHREPVKAPIPAVRKPAARYVICAGDHVLHEGKSYSQGDEVPGELVNNPAFAGHCVVAPA